VAGKAQTGKKPLVDEDRLTVQVAQTVMHWRVAPDRFIKSGRSWIPKWRFSPCTRIEDSFLLLDNAGGTYTLSLDAKGVFTAQVRIGNRVGKASGDSKPRTITRAIARALGLDGLQ
jgi:hypothetical protein